MSVEYTPRVSSCSLCKRSIIKGQKRFTISHQFDSPVQVKKGQMFRSRRFFHPECFATWVTEDPERPLASGTNYGPKFESDSLICVDCTTSLTASYTVAYLHRRSSHVYLCGSCRDSGRWRECRFCHQWVKRYQTSPIIDEPSIPPGHFSCDYCQAEENVNTVKSRKRRNREIRKSLDQKEPF